MRAPCQKSFPEQEICPVPGADQKDDGLMLNQTKTLQQLSISDVKMLLLTGNIGKAYKVRNHFCFDYRRNSRHFFKLGAWRTVKARACLL